MIVPNIFFTLLFSTTQLQISVPTFQNIFSLQSPNIITSLSIYIHTYTYIHTGFVLLGFVLLTGRPAKRDKVAITEIPLAALAHNRCTSLVCYCYVPSRKSYEGEDNTCNHRKNIDGGDRLLEIQDYNSNDGGCTDSSISNTMSLNNGSCETIHSNNIHVPLKSNLKKSSSNCGKKLVLVVEEEVKQVTKKVSWPDAHGKDIAHVQEFHSSPRDWELEGVRNSCICVIQ